MNNVSLSGRITATPEIYNGGSDNAVAKFNLAVDRPVKKGKEKETDFFSIVCFGKKAEFASQYLAKGTAVIVSGRLSQSSYTDKETGKKRYTIEVVADSLEFQLGNSKPEAQAQPQPVAAPPQPQGQPTQAAPQGYYVPQGQPTQAMPPQGYYVPQGQPTQAMPPQAQPDPSQAFVPMTGGAVFH